ncbi:MAG: hypothetical protein U1A78_02370 [Polyangia bacterium]
MLNPATDCEYPFLAAPLDRSMLLSLGDHGLLFEFALPPETERWLAEDFIPILEGSGDTVALDLTSLRYVLDRTFRGGVEFGIMHFDDAMRPISVELSPCVRDLDDEGPEFQVHCFGEYERILRDADRPDIGRREGDRRRMVTLAERAALDICCATFAPLAAAMPHRLAAPPPRYWQLAAS